MPGVPLRRALVTTAALVLFLGFVVQVTLLSRRFPFFFAHHMAHNDTLLSSPAPSQRRLPDAIIIGVKKGGTTALRRYLLQHPGVCMAQAETHFFKAWTKFKRGLWYYRSLMPECSPGSVTMEKTPGYFTHASVPRHMRTYLGPNLKLILVLRDPVDRLHSDYHFERRRERTDKNNSLDRLLFLPNSTQVDPSCAPVSTSCYDVHMRRWLQFFSLRSFLFIDNEALKEKPLRELHRVEHFLGIPEHFTQNNLKLGSKAKFLHYSHMTDSTRHRLVEFFTPHSLSFFRLVNTTFPWQLDKKTMLRWQLKNNMSNSTTGESNVAKPAS